MPTRKSGIPIWLACLVALVAALAGCADDGRGRVPDWTLSVAGRAPHALHLPADFAGALPPEPCRYELRTAVPMTPELRGRELVLTLPVVDAFATLRVDGEAFEPLDRAVFDRVRPSERRLAFRIPARATDRDVLRSCSRSSTATPSRRASPRRAWSRARTTARARWRGRWSAD